MIVTFIEVNDFYTDGYRVIDTKNIGGTFNMPQGSMVRIQGEIYEVGSLQWFDADGSVPTQYVELKGVKSWITKS